MKIRAASRGVTLIELLVIVAIIGIVVGIGMPNLFAFLQQQRLQAAAITMANHLNATRLLAMLKGVPHEVQMKDFKNGNYYQVVESDGDRIISGIGRVVLDKEFGGVKLVKFALPIEKGSGAGILKFSPAGTSTSTTIELENEKKTRIKIIVANGRVRLES